jgi:hypothetical protein
MFKILVLSVLLLAVNSQPMPGFGDSSEESGVSDFFGKIKSGISDGASKLKEGIEKGASKVYTGAEKAYDKVKDSAKDGYQYVKEKIQGTTPSPLDKFVNNLSMLPDSKDKAKEGENFLYDIDVRSIPLAGPAA